MLPFSGDNDSIKMLFYQLHGRLIFIMAISALERRFFIEVGMRYYIHITNIFDSQLP